MMDMAVDYLKRGIYSTQAFYQYSTLQAKRYRANIFFKLMGFPTRFLIIFALWSAVLSSNNESDTTYYIMYYAGVFLILLMYPYVRVANATVGQDIFNGEIVKYTSKGIPYWSVRLADWLVVVKYYIPLIFGVFVLVVSILLNQFDVLAVISFLYLLVIGSLMQLVLWTIIGMGAFWLDQTQGVSRLFIIAQDLLTGALIPIHLFSSQLQDFVSYLPFQYFVYVPLQVLMGETTKSDMIGYLYGSSGWLILLLTLAFFIWKMGIKRYNSPLL